MLEDVKKALGIEGDYQDDNITPYIESTLVFIRKAGVKESDITAGLVARGVSDTWNYGAGEGKFSQSFMYMVAQLALGE